MWSWVALVVVLAAFAGTVAWLVARLLRIREELANAVDREHELNTAVDRLKAETAAMMADSIGPDPALDFHNDPPDSLTDPVTGLFNEQFFRVTLDARVSAARRHLRPVAVVLLQVARGVREGEPADVAPVVVANGIRSTLRDADTACRLDDGRFALILEDTPENGAVWTVERVRRALSLEHPGQTLWAGIACYPAHAFDAWELLERAGQALVAAREWHQDRIEVATAE